MLYKCFLFVYTTRDTGDVMTSYVNSLTPIFSKPVFKTDFINYKKSN